MVRTREEDVSSSNDISLHFSAQGREGDRRNSPVNFWGFKNFFWAQMVGHTMRPSPLASKKRLWSPSPRGYPKRESYRPRQKKLEIHNFFGQSPCQYFFEAREFVPMLFLPIFFVRGPFSCEGLSGSLKGLSAE